MTRFERELQDDFSEIDAHLRANNIKLACAACFLIVWGILAWWLL
jgi:hypothetical protein